mmetsp:Transcript_7856/g.14594  ORF Transcript_7856/g.14594 Transcript_7856/m.14594 type:complete len:102 (-) Transcript_7856:223-528(-)
MADKKQLIGLQNLYSPSPALPPQPLPERFTKPEIIQYKTMRKQHPMYRTTANDYGSKVPKAEELPQAFCPLRQKFTKKFSGGMFRDEGLVTSTTNRSVPLS